MNIKLGCLVLLTVNALTASAGELRFDQNGRMLAPDQTYLEQGIDSQGRGHLNDAMRHFKKSARFGNPYAQSAIAFMHMQDKDYLGALAWFNLVDLKMVENDVLISDLINELDHTISGSKRQQLNTLSDQLKETYGKVAALDHREQWQKSISFGGTKIKGYIPSRIKIYPSGQISRGPGGDLEIFVSSAVVTGEVVKKQMNKFIYEYDLKFTHGNVTLQDVEYVEEEKQI